MSVCTRCGISAWHPEAFACTSTDCEIRLPTPLPVAADPNTSSRPLAGGPAPRVTGGFVDDRASDRETDALGRQVQSVAVHGDRYAIDAVFPSSGKADDISGEARA